MPKIRRQRIGLTTQLDPERLKSWQAWRNTQWLDNGILLAAILTWRQ
jgi:hypothetical protein